MKNELSDLNNYLFAQLERLDDESLSENELELEIERAKALAMVSSQIIQNANTCLNVAKFRYDKLGDCGDMPKMLGSGNVG